MKTHSVHVLRNEQTGNVFWACFTPGLLVNQNACEYNAVCLSQCILHLFNASYPRNGRMQWLQWTNFYCTRHFANLSITVWAKLRRCALDLTLASLDLILGSFNMWSNDPVAEAWSYEPGPGPAHFTKVKKYDVKQPELWTGQLHDKREFDIPQNKPYKNSILISRDFHHRLLCTCVRSPQNCHDIQF